MKLITDGEGARHFHMVEIFEASETAKALPAIGDLLFGIKCIKGIAVSLREANTIILNDKAIDIFKAVDDVRLSTS